MNAAERMTVLCADRRKQAGERGDSESWEVWEDLEDLFGQVARVLENEPEATVRPFMSGMARALAVAAGKLSRLIERNEPTKEQVEAAAGFLRDNLRLFGPQACFLETGHIDEIAYGMLRAAGKAAH